MVVAKASCPGNNSIGTEKLGGPNAPERIELEALPWGAGALLGQHDHDASVFQKRAGYRFEAGRRARYTQQQIGGFCRRQVDASKAPEEFCPDLALLHRSLRHVEELVTAALRHQDRSDLAEQAQHLHSQAGGTRNHQPLRASEAKIGRFQRELRLRAQRASGGASGREIAKPCRDPRIGDRKRPRYGTLRLTGREQQKRGDLGRFKRLGIRTEFVNAANFELGPDPPARS